VEGNCLFKCLSFFSIAEADPLVVSSKALHIMVVSAGTTEHVETALFAANGDCDD